MPSHPETFLAVIADRNTTAQGKPADDAAPRRLIVVQVVCLFSFARATEGPAAQSVTWRRHVQCLADRDRGFEAVAAWVMKIADMFLDGESDPAGRHQVVSQIKRMLATLGDLEQEADRSSAIGGDAQQMTDR